MSHAPITYFRGPLDSFPSEIRHEIKEVLKDNPFMAEFANFFVYFKNGTVFDEYKKIDESGLRKLQLKSGWCYCICVLFEDEI